MPEVSVVTRANRFLFALFYSVKAFSRETVLLFGFCSFNCSIGRNRYGLRKLEKRGNERIYPSLRIYVF